MRVNSYLQPPVRRALWFFAKVRSAHLAILNGEIRRKIGQFPGHICGPLQIGLGERKINRAVVPDFARYPMASGMRQGIDGKSAPGRTRRRNEQVDSIALGIEVIGVEYLHHQSPIGVSRNKGGITPITDEFLLPIGKDSDAPRIFDGREGMTNDERRAIVCILFRLGWWGILSPCGLGTQNCKDRHEAGRKAPSSICQ
jgi:hypothetical protein